MSQRSLSLPKVKVPGPAYECTTTQHQNDNTELNENIQCEVIKKKKKPLWSIVICFFLTVFTVVTLIALAIGALGYNSAQHNRSSNAQFGTETMTGAEAMYTVID